MMSILLLGEVTAVVLLDQPAMFDTTDHSLLIECLSSWFGVGGVVLLTGSSCTSVTTISASRLALFYPMKNAIVWCAPGLCPGSSPVFIICYLPQQNYSNHLGICFHLYADDTSLDAHLMHKHVTEAFDRLKNYLDDVTFCKQA